MRKYHVRCHAPELTRRKCSVLFTYIKNRTILTRPTTFAPDPRLFRPDADLWLIFLSGRGVGFYDRTEDPWYRGFLEWGWVMDKDRQWNKTVYRPDEAASPMGCIQQYQYCNAEHKCGELASFTDAMITAAPVFDTTPEMLAGDADPSGQKSSSFGWFETIMYSSYDLTALLNALGPTALASRREHETGYFG